MKLLEQPTSKTASTPSLDDLASCTCAPFAKPCSPKAKCRQTISYPSSQPPASTLGMGWLKDSIASLTATNPSVKNVTKPEPKNKMKNEKPRNQPEPSIPSVKGKTIALKNLRPGDWVRFLPLSTIASGDEYVIHNTPSRARLEIVSQYSGSFVWSYHTSRMPEIYEYLGRGKKRKWLDKLPKCVSSLFCPYSGPRK